MSFFFVSIASIFSCNSLYEYSRGQSIESKSKNKMIASTDEMSDRRWWDDLCVIRICRFREAGEAFEPSKSFNDSRYGISVTNSCKTSVIVASKVKVLSFRDTNVHWAPIPKGSKGNDAAWLPSLIVVSVCGGAPGGSRSLLTSSQKFNAAHSVHTYGW